MQSTKTTWPMAVVLALVMLVVASCGGASTSVATESTTDGAPEAAAAVAEADAPVELLSGGFATVSGGQIELGDLQGQDVVLWFWAPW